jgi:Orsellinic acid/F9775 biosynthesis cluster protein D
MENHQLAENYVQYNAELKILTCIQHKHAIPPGNDENNQSKIDRHFRDTHKPHGSISKKTRAAINEYASTLNLIEPSQVTIPLAANGPVKGLRVYDGGKCLICDELTAQTKDMLLHCKQEHGVEAEEELHWKKQTVQSIFSGPHYKYALSQII